MVTYAHGGLSALIGKDGYLLNPATLAPEDIARIDFEFPVQERARIAMSVAQHYTGGDYFEFGAIGGFTFRNFLSAFKLFRMDQQFPDTYFWAFDAFGVIDDDVVATTLTESEKAYYVAWRDTDEVPKRHHSVDYFRRQIEEHGLLLDRIRIVEGTFQTTLTGAKAAAIKAEKRRIGFAFIDCNVVTAYDLCLDFILDGVSGGSYVYFDERFVQETRFTVEGGIGSGNPFDIRPAIRRFERRLAAERGLGLDMITNAGCFGALYIVRPFLQGDPP